jgi:hypothetical protein
VWLGGLAVALVLTGCGAASSGSERIAFGSPAVRDDGVISAHYRCGGGTIWLPLKWGSLPADTKELALYIGRFRAGTFAGSPSLMVFFGTLITGIDPAVHGIATNTLPPGSIPASYRTFYSCPSERRGQEILLAVFAFDRVRREPPPASLSAGFVTGLTEELVGVDGSDPGSESAAKLIDEALAVGRFTATYGPG